MLSPVMCLVRAWWPLALLQLTEHEPQLDQEPTRQTPARVSGQTVRQSDTHCRWPPPLRRWCSTASPRRLHGCNFSSLFSSGWKSYNVEVDQLTPPLQELHLSHGDQ